MVKGSQMLKGEFEDRLTPDQEDTLYCLVMRQDDYGYEPTLILLSELKANAHIMDMVDKGFVEFSIVNPGSKHEFASCAVTLKGIRYYSAYADELPHRSY